jgi:hypothetical protein
MSVLNPRWRFVPTAPSDRNDGHCRSHSLDLECHGGTGLELFGLQPATQVLSAFVLHLCVGIDSNGSFPAAGEHGREAFVDVNLPQRCLGLKASRSADKTQDNDERTQQTARPHSFSIDATEHSGVRL